MEPTGHCPFLGLKQNRAIRFSSPTPEHRCYVGGDPIEIPVDQASYCLSHNHTQCPLYMGLSVSTTNDIPTIPLGAGAPRAGLGGWLASLSPRDRLIYAIMLGMLAVIIVIYLIAGFQSLSSLPGGLGDRTGVPSTPAAGQPTEGIAGAASATPPAPTAPGLATSTQPPAPTASGLTTPTQPPTPTNLPTSTPSPQPTAEPTREPVFFPPTALPTQPPTSTSAPLITIPPTVTSSQGPPPTLTPAAQATATQATTVQATAAQVTATPRQSAPTPIPPTATSAPIPPTATSAPPTATPRQSAPTPIPPTATSAPAPTAIPAPTAPPPLPETRSEIVWLYFGDATGTLFVPVQRRTTVENRQSAHAALRELLAGPQSDLVRLTAPGVRLLGVRIEDGTAFANFDADPTGGNPLGADAIVLTLTHFQSIQRVQIQVNGQNIGGPRARPVVNPLNPQGLPVDVRQTEFLPLYFLSNDGYHHVRVIRMVPKTRQTAEGTVRALLDGPGDYSYALQRLIPVGTELRGIRIDSGIVSVDFTQPFAEAGNRSATVRTVVESLTTLPGVRGVRFLIEGTSMGDWWGQEYGGVFERPLINGE